MLDLRQQAVPAALVAVLFCSVAVGLIRYAMPAAGSGQQAVGQIGADAKHAACPLTCDADGDGLLDALLLPGVIIGIARLIPLRSRVHPQPYLLAGRSVPPLPPPPRKRG